MKKQLFEKPSRNNSFFTFPVIVIFINYILILISYYVQNNVSSMFSWNLAVRISEVSLLIIFIILITRVIFIFMKKINLIEFIIGFFMNLAAFYFCFKVIMDRI